MTEEDIFYVGIRDPLELRKELLKSSKHTVQILKRYYTLRDIRREKAELIIELRKIMGELDFLNKKLAKVLPKTGLRAATTKTKASKPSAKTTRAARPGTELDKLEAELSKIESKIKSLG